MKKIVITTLTAALFFCATSVMATMVYYQASNVSGVGEITYDSDGSDGFDAPSFSFTAGSGTVTENLATLVPGTYTAQVTLEGFWADFNEDGSNELPSSVAAFVAGNLGFASLSTFLGTGNFNSGVSAPFTLSSTPFLDDSIGPLAWVFAPYSGLELTYDFTDIPPFTNANVSTLLAGIDSAYSGDANGSMTANMGWTTFRVELNSAPVPEPATLLLLGSGLAGLAFYRRKRK